jgi:hypothetical protein
LKETPNDLKNIFRAGKGSFTTENYGFYSSTRIFISFYGKLNGRISYHTTTK